MAMLCRAGDLQSVAGVQVFASSAQAVPQVLALAAARPSRSRVSQRMRMTGTTGGESTPPTLVTQIERRAILPRPRQCPQCHGLERFRVAGVSGAGSG